jgi:hypothetical protein
VPPVTLKHAFATYSYVSVISGSNSDDPHFFFVDILMKLSTPTNLSCPFIFTFSDRHVWRWNSAKMVPWLVWSMWRIIVLSFSLSERIAYTALCERRFASVEFRASAFEKEISMANVIRDTGSGVGKIQFTLTCPYTSMRWGSVEYPEQIHGAQLYLELDLQ